MTTRAERIGSKRPRKAYEVPTPRDWWGILDDIPHELGVELALVVRRIWLAAGCPPTRRESLFRVSRSAFVAERREEALAQLAADVRHELRVLLTVYTPEHPSEVEIAAAAEALTEWAQASGHACTALNLAEAGAIVAPTHAHAAFIAARTNRQVGEAWRAEVYYRRAILLAYREQQWKDYICAQLGFGTLLVDRGDLIAAAQRYERAARKADDQGIEWLAAQTFHDLASLHFQRGDVDAAIESVKSALTIYPRLNERVPVAVHDLAFLHLLREHHIEAMALLELLIPLPLLPHDQVLVSGSLARAAGALGQQSLYAEAAARVAHFAPQHKQHADAAYVNLAYGARALGLWAVAAEHAGHAARLAAEAEHAFVERVAWELLIEITTRKACPPPAPPLTGPQAAEIKQLANSLREQLGGWRWNPDQSGPGRLGPSHC